MRSEFYLKSSMTSQLPFKTKRIPGCLFRRIWKGQSRMGEALFSVNISLSTC